MLLAKTLRSSTFKAALLLIAIFGAMVVALLWFVYSSTASYILARSDRAIDTDRTILLAAYGRTGHDGLIAAIKKLVADKRFEDSVVLLADRSFSRRGGEPEELAASLARQRRTDQVRDGGTESGNVGTPTVAGSLRNTPGWISLASRTGH